MGSIPTKKSNNSQMDLPFSVLLQVAHIWEERAISYVLVGSLASSMHGMYRSTADIDILADVKPEQVRPLLEALQESFYVDEHAMRAAQRNAVRLMSSTWIQFSKSTSFSRKLMSSLGFNW